MKNKPFFSSITMLATPLVSLVLLCGNCGCSYIKPYHVEIQQGNALDTNTLQQIHLGMTKNQVIDLLGNPILNNPFNDNELTYVYNLRSSNGEETQKKHVNLLFAKEKLIKIEK